MQIYSHVRFCCVPESYLILLPCFLISIPKLLIVHPNTLFLTTQVSESALVSFCCCGTHPKATCKQVYLAYRLQAIIEENQGRSLTHKPQRHPTYWIAPSSLL